MCWGASTTKNEEGKVQIKGSVEKLWRSRGEKQEYICSIATTDVLHK